MKIDLSLIQQEVDALEELSRQLFLETVDLHATKATINIVFDRVGKTDPVTRGIEITVNYLGIQFDFFYAISSSKSSNVIVLVLAQIMGMYFVSSVLLMRMSMPLEYRTIVTEVLGELQFSFYHRWFDVIFLVSALSSILFLYLAHKQAPEKNMTI
ncbi:GPHR regulator, partial [Polypterus senegalus]